MTRIRFKHVDRFTDRNGHTRHYFRRGKGPRIVLPGLPGSAEFMRAYEAALANQPPAARTTPPRGAPGTFDALVQLYYGSSDYARLAPATRQVYRSIIDGVVHAERIGHRLVREMRREHVSKMMVNRAANPASANQVAKKLRLLIRFAIAHGWRQDDPSSGITLFREGTHHTWTDAEIATFEARWPVGTLERTAFALLLFSGQRVGDVARMGWNDLDGAGLQVTQGKTGAKLWVPLHADLAAIFAAWPRAHVSILVNARGGAFTSPRLGKRLAEAIAKAGLPTRCVVHGLRKAAARRLADAGCTAHQIMAITGHRSLAEVARYTRDAEQRALAVAAMARLQGQDPNKNSQP
jgi:integrase